MKTRYVVMKKRPRARYDDWGDWWPDQSSITVLEDETEPRPTGLLNAQGHEFMAVTHRNPIGFTAEIEDEE